METEVRERFERMERILKDVHTGMQSFQQSLVNLVYNLEQYATASNARMTRVEKNLDLLIQAITGGRAS